MDRWIRLAGVGLVAASLGLGLVVFRGALDRIGTPYPGFFTVPRGAVAFIVPDPALLAGVGLKPGDRIAAVDGVPVRTGPEVWQLIAAATPGSLVRYVAERRSGSRFEFSLPVQVFERQLFLRLVVPVMLGGVLLLAIGVLVLLLRPDRPDARAMFIFCWSLGTAYFFLPFDNLFEARLFVGWNLVGGVARASFLHLALVFPEPRLSARRWARRTVLAGLYGFMLAQSVVYAVMLKSPTAWTALSDTLSYSVLALGAIGFAGSVLHAALRGKTAQIRQRARVALLGPALGCVMAAAAIAFVLSGSYVPYLLLTSPIFVFALGLAYALLRHNLFEFDAVMRQGIALAGALMLVSLSYLALFVVATQLAGSAAGSLAAAAAIATLVLLVPLFHPLRSRIERVVEAMVFPGRREAVRVVREASRELARVRDAGTVVARLHQAISHAVHAAHVRVVGGPPDAALHQLGDHKSPLELGPTDALALALRQGESLRLDGPQSKRALRRLEQLDVHLAIPFPARAELAGGFLLGPRSDGRLYTRDDAELLEGLAAQAVVALENAQVWDEIHSLHKRLAQENVDLRREIELQHGFEEIVGSSPAIKAVLAQVEQVAPTGASVLVIGETGTGKELVVRALHRLSQRAERPLVKVACAAIPETLLESELFGHERGAFTGATARQLGRFEVADGGTLFLDDVDTLPLAIQAKLLRAIQEGEVQRLGAAQVKRVDVRLVAATNRELLDEVRAGRFREDLYYRLHVVPIRLPPLRERREDLRALVAHIVERESAKLGREVRPIAGALLEALERYDWPGNVRELRNVIERAVVMSRGEVIELPGPLVAAGAQRPTAGGNAPGLDGRPLAERLRQFKLDLIQAALDSTDGNQRAAAELLGLHRQSLSRMMRELGLEAGK